MTLPYQDASLSTDARLEDLIGRMSVEQMVGQMVQADGRVRAEEQVREQSAGSFLHILGEDTIQLQKLATETGLGIPLIFGIDAIHGHGFWPGATVFPTQLGISCSWAPERLKEMGRVTAREMLATGLHWTFSPVLCLTRDLRWGRVNETFGEDPYLLGVLGAALVEGYQGSHPADPDSVLACAKHFAGYSQTVGGRDATEAELSERLLRSTFLPAFEDMARAGCRTFMTAYQCIDGVSCVVNRWLLTEVLRGEWCFEGFVVTDWDNVGRTHKEQALYPSIEAAIPDSVRAGNDMIMVTPEFYQGALTQLSQGKLDRSDIELACRRVLRQKLDLGLFDHKRFPQHNPSEIIGCEEHRKHLLPSALESVVLLKNGSKSQSAPLPLANNLKRVAVLGPNADDTLAQLGDWSFGSGQAGLSTGSHPRELVSTVLDGMKEQCQRRGIELVYERGCDVLDSDRSGIGAAVSAATAADVAVVVVGDVLEQIGETCDRAELELTGGQQTLLEAVHATGTPLVVVLINSKPLAIPWVAEHANAILEAFNPGMEGGRAVAQLLFGEANPMGKLTTSFARSAGAQPAHYQEIPGWHGNSQHTYNATPLFPFGFGLSYTRFEYLELQLSSQRVAAGDSLTVQIQVRNAGTRAGTEITQLYINDTYTMLSTPSKTLRSYARSTLAPGETQTLTFTLGPRDLAYMGPSKRWTVESGTFEVMVGGSSRDEDLLKTSFEVTGPRLEL